MKQLIFVVESTRKANTDGRYLRVLLDFYYALDSSVKISFVYLNGKGNYNKRTIKKQIDDNRKKFHGESYVLYLLDKDQLDTSSADKNLNLTISQFCEQNDYKILWFVRTIEHVFLHEIVGKTEKVKRAASFHISMMNKVREDALSCQVPVHDKTSNILCVLDTCLKEYRRINVTTY